MGRVTPSHWDLGTGVQIHRGAQVNVTERLVIGDYGVVHEGCVIEGRDIEIGQELWMSPGAIIGGGSRYERQSSLRAGHFLHLGRDVLINTARAVTIGDEVGLGTGTAIFTHGAYLSALDGFPVSFAPVVIGSRVWLPGAIVNPGVHIGSNVVVGVGSVVTRDIPDGALAMGIPAKVVREDAFPQDVDKEIFWAGFISDFADLGEDTSQIKTYANGWGATVGATIFSVIEQHVVGPVTPLTERFRDQLRRHGIRFYSRPEAGEYRDWR